MSQYKPVRVATYYTPETTTPIPVTPVECYGDLVYGNLASQKTIDWNSRSDRKWLESHNHWAMMHNMAVALYPESC